MRIGFSGAGGVADYCGGSALLRGRRHQRRITDHRPAPAERSDVLRDGDAVQLDGGLHAGRCNRQRARLYGHADNKDVRCHR